MNLWAIGPQQGGREQYQPVLSTMPKQNTTYLKSQCDNLHLSLPILHIHRIVDCPPMMELQMRLA